MQFYLLDKKSLKQALTNAKSFLKSKSIQMPPGMIEELTAKIFFQKNWNDAVANSELPLKKQVSKKTIHCQLNQIGSKPTTIDDFKSVLKHCCELAEFPFSAITEIVNIETNLFQCKLEKNHSGASNEYSNESSYLNLNSEHLFVALIKKSKSISKITIEHVDVFIESHTNAEIKPEPESACLDSSSMASNLAKDFEVEAIMRTAFGKLYAQMLIDTANPGSSYYLQLCRQLIRAFCNLDSIPKAIPDKIDFIRTELRNAPDLYKKLNAGYYGNSGKELQSILSKYADNDELTQTSIIEYGALTGRLAMLR